MNSENSTNPKNEKIDYKFICLPKNACLLLNGNERSILSIMIDKQQIVDLRKETKGNNFEMSISYFCQNLNITDKTVQRAINKLIELNLVIKHSGYKTRTKNTYSINFEKIREYDKLSNDQLFEMRGTSKKAKPTKSIENIEAIEFTDSIEPLQTNEATQPVNSEVINQQQFEPIEIMSPDLTEQKNEQTESDVIAKLENYFETKNNRVFDYYEECIKSIHDYFTDKELKYVLANIDTLMKNQVIPRNVINKMESEVRYFSPVRKPEVETDYNLDFLVERKPTNFVSL